MDLIKILAYSIFRKLSLKKLLFGLVIVCVLILGSKTWAKDVANSWIPWSTSTYSIVYTDGSFYFDGTPIAVIYDRLGGGYGGPNQAYYIYWHNNLLCQVIANAYNNQPAYEACSNGFLQMNNSQVVYVSSTPSLDSFSITLDRHGSWISHNFDIISVPSTYSYISSSSGVPTNFTGVLFRDVSNCNVFDFSSFYSCMGGASYFQDYGFGIGSGGSTPPGGDDLPPVTINPGASDHTWNELIDIVEKKYPSFYPGQCVIDTSTVEDRPDQSWMTRNYTGGYSGVDVGIPYTKTEYLNIFDECKASSFINLAACQVKSEIYDYCFAYAEVYKGNGDEKIGDLSGSVISDQEGFAFSSLEEIWASVQSIFKLKELFAPITENFKDGQSFFDDFSGLNKCTNGEFSYIGKKWDIFLFLTFFVSLFYLLKR